jgi:hypothetical protein
MMSVLKLNPLVLVSQDRNLLAVLAETYDGPITKANNIVAATEYTLAQRGRAVMAVGPDVRYVGEPLPIGHLLLHTDPSFLDRTSVLYRTASQILELPAELDWLLDRAAMFFGDPLDELDQMLGGEEAA